MEKQNPRVFYRYFVDSEGRAFVTFEPRKDVAALHQQIHPITPEQLELARGGLFNRLSEHQKPAAPEELERIDRRRHACEELRGLLRPHQSRRLAHRLKSLALSVFGVLIAAPGLYILLTLPFRLLLAARQKLPEPLYLFAVAACSLALIVGLSMVAAARRKVDRGEETRQPADLIFFLGLVLAVALAVFAAGTLTLHEHGLVRLETCRLTEVSMGSLTKFYVWHLLELVPLRINNTLKWTEPLCYSQGATGFLVLAFQAFVVIPCVSGIISFWKGRDSLVREDFIFDPDWLPPASPSPSAPELQ
jgi:hypothetical protein